MTTESLFLPATREQAYVYAISSAALTFTMARACSSGSLYHCTCASKPSSPTNGQFQWGGCGDNIKWGTQFAKRFIDNVEKYTLEKSKPKLKRDIGGGNTEEDEKMVRNEVAAVNLHNNRVGRKVSRRVFFLMSCHRKVSFFHNYFSPMYKAHIQLIP